MEKNSDVIPLSACLDYFCLSCKGNQFATILKVLFISYDGMTDQLGQSQVIPYLSGLSARGHEIWLMSAEKPEPYTRDEQLIAELLGINGIHWIPFPYTSSPPVLSTIKDIRRMRREALRCVLENKIDALHCRSYISALTGMFVKRKTGRPWIFDMRGFWADERVDGGIWNLKNPLFRLIYKYFKRKEKQYLRDAAGVVSLTRNAALEINSWKGFEHIPVNVIPCCADLQLFKKDSFQVDFFRTTLKINPDAFVLSYLGSLGTWYMLDEMLDFFKILVTQKPKAIFLFITGDEPELIISKALNKGISPEAIRVRKAARKEVPLLASLSSASIFFIKPVFSKKASSPTKMGELMSMGIPLICNSGVGDVEQILLEGGNGLLVHNFNDSDYNLVVNQLDRIIQMNPQQEIACAEKYYSLENGINLYDQLYRRIAQSL
jgi:glycosyltransferase involved in cell wall biosynthesis